jgi:hypothetical protein
MGKLIYTSNILNHDARCKRSASHLFRFDPREIAPGTHWIEHWVGPRIGLKAMEKRKIYFPLLRIEPQPSSPYVIVIPTELSRILLDFFATLQAYVWTDNELPARPACLLYFSTMKMEAVCSSKTSANVYYTAPRHIPNYNVWAV